MKRTSSTTIVIAMLAIGLLAAAADAGLLSVDINGNQGSAGGTQTGFDGWDIADGTNSAVSQSFGSIDVTITAVGATTFTARNRSYSFGGSINEAALHRDWVNGGVDADNATTGDGAGAGMDILIEGLASNTTYPVTIWSYESGSQGQGNAGSASDWRANGTLVQDNWIVIERTNFDEDSDGRFTFDATADANGKLLIEARGSDWLGVDPGEPRERAFLNGIEIVPEPATLTLLGLAGAVMLGGRKRRA